MNKPYYFIPEPLRTALLDEFKNTYKEEKDKFEGSSVSGHRQVSQHTGAARQTGEKLSTIMTTLSSHAPTTGGGYGLPTKKLSDRDIRGGRDNHNDSYHMDPDQRIYLKRLRQTEPKANIALPDGYYETDEDEAAHKERVAKRLTSKHGVFSVNERSGGESAMADRRKILKKLSTK